MADSKLLCRDALLRLCETGRLSKITVSDLAKEAGVSRQAFYNNFRDINELVSYTAIGLLSSSSLPSSSSEFMVHGLQVALQHKSFFCQLPGHLGQNSFRETYCKLLCDTYSAAYTEGSMDEAERLRRRLCIVYSAHGATGMFLEWCAEGMKTPVEVVVEAARCMRADFVRRDPFRGKIVLPSRDG